MNNRRLAWGTVASVIVSLIKVGLNLVSVPLMARLVGPADYGLFALASPVVSFVLLLAEGGFGISLSRESEENKDVWSTATIFLLGFGLTLGVGLIAWSFVQASIVRQPELRPMMLALSVCPLLLALTVPASARLTRQGRLGIASAVDLVAIIAGISAAVGIALAHGGVWSLVAQPLAYWSVKAILINIAAPSWPQFRFATRHLRPHLQVGGLILSGKFLDTGGRTLETSLVSRFLGNQILGAYAFAGQLPRFLTETIGNSLWGLLYAYTLHNDDPAGLTRTYRLALRVFALSVFPASVFISIVVKPLLDVLMGPRWDAAIFLLKILLVTHAVNSLGGIGSAILYAKGLPRIPFRISIESVTLRILVVVIGCGAGLEWIAIGLGAVDVYLGFRGIFSLRKVMDTPVRVAISAALGPAIMSGVAGMFCWALIRSDFLGSKMPILAATISYVAISSLFYCALLILFERRKVIADFTSVYRLLRR
jgi:O-antigen/teichoic acid export membrane protein